MVCCFSSSSHLILWIDLRQKHVVTLHWLPRSGSQRRTANAHVATHRQHLPRHQPHLDDTAKPNQTKPNDRKQKGKKITEKKKRERVSIYEEIFCSLSISRTGSKEERSSVCVSSLPRPTPANRNKEDNGRVGALRRNRNGKERKNQPWKFNGDPNR